MPLFPSKDGRAATEMPPMRLTALLMILLPLSLPAQPLGSKPEPVPAACTAGEYRQFDFWIGDWNVISGGRLAGTNSVRSIHGGCALLENWLGAGPGGIGGTSLNIYDQATGNWRQTWVDGNGLLLELSGGLIDGVMTLTGSRPAPHGRGDVRDRISWTPNADGTVRQLWESSSDGGNSWQVIFDGLYTRSGPQG